MRLRKDGEPVIDETKIGKVRVLGEFPADPSDVAVETVSDVWRVIRLSVPDRDTTVTPRAARTLARILIRAADKAQEENAEIIRVQKAWANAQRAKFGAKESADE